MNQARIGALRRGGYDAKILVVCGATDGIRRCELRSIKDIEEFRAKFQTQALIDAKLSSLKNGEIKIVDSQRTQSRVHARLIAKGKVRGRGKTRGLKPSQEGEVVRVAKA